MCVNVISQVGFGKGDLKIVGGRGKRFNFVIPPLGKENRGEFIVLTGPRIAANLNFKWFIANIICDEKPNLCPTPRGGNAISRNS